MLPLGKTVDLADLIREETDHDPVYERLDARLTALNLIRQKSAVGCSGCGQRIGPHLVRVRRLSGQLHPRVRRSSRPATTCGSVSAFTRPPSA